MKTATNKPKASKDASRLTTYPATPQKVADETFLKSVNVKAGTNDITDTFLNVVMARVTSTLASWSFSDVIYYAAPYAFDTMQLKELFDRWCDAMVKVGKIEETPSCYSEPLFVRLN